MKENSYSELVRSVNISISKSLFDCVHPLPTLSFLDSIECSLVPLSPQHELVQRVFYIGLDLRCLLHEVAIDVYYLQVVLVLLVLVAYKSGLGVQ